MRPILTALVVVLALALLPDSLRSGPTATSMRMHGLTAPVTVTTDRWGIPHLEAASLPDLYVAWGWVAARDRLWQLTATRAAAEGRTHRWLGNAALQADGGAQLFRLRERAAAIWRRERADSSVAMPLERYAEGVNAYLNECRSGQRPWPAELVRLGERPRDWTPEDCVLVLLGFGITLDLELPELAELRTIRQFGQIGRAHV